MNSNLVVCLYFICYNRRGIGAQDTLNSRRIRARELKIQLLKTGTDSEGA